MIASEKVFVILKNIPIGKVTTYKALAAAAGNPKAARTVGNILNKNQNLISVPCHRVVKSNGEVGGYVLGKNKKVELLRKEGVKIYAGKVRKSFILEKL